MPVKRKAVSHGSSPNTLPVIKKHKTAAVPPPSNRPDKKLDKRPDKKLDKTSDKKLVVIAPTPVETNPFDHSRVRDPITSAEYSWCIRSVLIHKNKGNCKGLMYNVGGNNGGRSNGLFEDYKSIRDIIGDYARRSYPGIGYDMIGDVNCSVCKTPLYIDAPSIATTNTVVVMRDSDGSLILEEEKKQRKRIFQHNKVAVPRHVYTSKYGTVEKDVYEKYHCGKVSCLTTIYGGQRDLLVGRNWFPVDWLDSSVFPSKTLNLVRSSGAIESTWAIYRLHLASGDHDHAIDGITHSGIMVEMHLMTLKDDMKTWYDTQTSRRVPLEWCIQWNPFMWSKLPRDSMRHVVFPVSAEGRLYAGDDTRYNRALYGRYVARFARIRMIHRVLKRGLQTDAVTDTLGVYVMSFLVNYPIRYQLQQQTQATRVQDTYDRLVDRLSQPDMVTMFDIRCKNKVVKMNDCKDDVVNVDEKADVEHGGNVANDGDGDGDAKLKENPKVIPELVRPFYEFVSRPNNSSNIMCIRLNGRDSRDYYPELWCIRLYVVAKEFNNEYEFRLRYQSKSNDGLETTHHMIRDQSFSTYTDLEEFILKTMEKLFSDI